MGPDGRSFPLAIPRALHPALENDEDDAVSPPPSPPLATNSAQAYSTSASLEMPSLRTRRNEVYAELANVCEKWGIVDSGSTSTRPAYSRMSGIAADSAVKRTSSPAPPGESIDNMVLDLLHSTANAIRIAQRYFHSLPQDRLPPGAQIQVASDSSTVRPSTLGLVTASRPIPKHASMAPSPSTSRLIPTSISTSPAKRSTNKEPFQQLRKASMAALGALKDIDLRYRISTPDPSVDGLGNDFESVSMGREREGRSSSVNITDDYSDQPSSTSSSTYDSSNGHLYSDHVTLADLAKEAKVVQDWIETVDSLLAETRKGGKTPMMSSSGERNQAVPLWARQEAYATDPVGRLHTCLAVHLPPELGMRLGGYSASMVENQSSSNGDRGGLLASLADGHLLCAGYNTVLSKSQRPWAFIPASSIHDVAGLAKQRRTDSSTASGTATPALTPATPAGRESLHPPVSHAMSRSTSDTLSDQGDGTSQDPTVVGLTFRRFENLRLFAAAIRLRYLVPQDASIDLKIIARKEFGWQDMLQRLAVQWVLAAAAEKRDEEVDSD